MGTKLKKDEDALWDIYHQIERAKLEQGLSQSHSRELAKQLIAERWEVQTEDIRADRENTLYTNLSKLMTLVFPKSARAEENLKREMQRATFNEALELARGNRESLQELRAKRLRSASQSIVNLGIPISEFLDFVVKQAVEQGYSKVELEQLFRNRVNGYFSH